MKKALHVSIKYSLRGLIIILPFLMILAFLRSVIDFLREHFIDAPWFLLIPGAFLILFPIGYMFSRHLGRIIVQYAGHISKEHISLRPYFIALQHFVHRVTLKEKIFTDAVWIIDPESNQRSIGFMTQKSMKSFGLPDDVCIFLPSAFSLQGQMVVVPKSQIEPITKNKEEAFALVMSAGLLAPEEVP